MKVSISKKELEINSKDLESIQEFLNNLVPGFVHEFGGILTDSMKFWRQKNSIRILLKTKDIIKKSGLKANELEGKFFVQVIEKASLEENEKLQEKWANLLAKASQKIIEQDIKYISILSELSLREVRLLNGIWEGKIKGKLLNFDENEPISEYILTTNKCYAYLEISLPRTLIVMDNFYRLNLFKSYSIKDKQEININSLIKTNIEFTLTNLGRDFLRATCSQQNLLKNSNVKNKSKIEKYFLS